jgi:hypothetical protein
MLIIGTIIISALCIYNYSVNKKASDALLNFVIAILTLFTISADTTKTTTFIIAYSLVTVIIILVSSMNVYISSEKILMRAAFELYGNDEKLKSHIKELFKIEKSAKSILLKPIERCEIILFFSQRKIPSENHAAYIKIIDDFKAGTGLDLNQCCQVMYFLIKVVQIPINRNSDIAELMQVIIENGRFLPISTKSYYELILEIQDVFFVGNKNALEILNEINGLCNTGHTTRYISKKLHNES